MGIAISLLSWLPLPDAIQVSRVLIHRGVEVSQCLLVNQMIMEGANLEALFLKEIAKFFIVSFILRCCCLVSLSEILLMSGVMGQGLLVAHLDMRSPEVFLEFLHFLDHIKLRLE